MAFYVGIKLRMFKEWVLKNISVIWPSTFFTESFLPLCGVENVLHFLGLVPRITQYNYPDHWKCPGVSGAISNKVVLFSGTQRTPIYTQALSSVTKIRECWLYQASWALRPCACSSSVLFQLLILTVCMCVSFEGDLLEADSGHRILQDP